MLLPQPYLYTSERMVAVRDRAQMAPREGVVADPVYGYHTLWAAAVPFIPIQSDELAKKDIGEHFQRTVQRQIRFLYGLVQSADHQTTFELRLIARPRPQGHPQIGIVFLGKSFHTEKDLSHQLALALWEKFNALFPHEVPFSYPLVPVAEHDGSNSMQASSFQDWFAPLAFNQLTTLHSIVEVRKYEDLPSIRDIGDFLFMQDYIPHPFTPAPDYSALTHLYEALARQPQVTVVSITLRPQRLTDQEALLLHEFAGWYQRSAQQKHREEQGSPFLDHYVQNNYHLQRWRHDNEHSVRAYQQTRAKLGLEVYDKLTREHHHLFLARLQVIGDPVAPDEVVEALGAMIVANTGENHPGRWSRVAPTTMEELHWARVNAQWLEFARWGISPAIQSERRMVRLRQLATVTEAVSAFCLPYASSKEMLAGVNVRHEPFTLPLQLSKSLAGDKPTPLLSSPHQEQIESGNSPIVVAVASIQEEAGHEEQGKNTDPLSLTLGMIADRGVPTTLPLSLSPAQRVNVLQVFGDESIYRSNLTQALLTTQESLPRILLQVGTSSHKFTIHQSSEKDIETHPIVLHDALTTCQLAFCPLLPPPGVALSPFLDAFLRVLQSVCKFETSMIPFLRKVLTETYKHAGWDGQESSSHISFATLADQLSETLRQMSEYARERAILQQRCIPLLRDLALTTEHIHWIGTDSLTDLLKEPVIIDIGEIGSESNTALLSGCLWAWYALALTALAGKQSTSSPLQGILGLEGAHTLFPLPEKNSNKHPLIALLHTSIRAGISLVFVDDRPDLLDREILNHTEMTLLTRSTVTPTLECFDMLIDASPAQKERLRQMETHEAIVKMRGIDPVHIVGV